MKSCSILGKKITTKKTVNNGVESVKIYENDVLTSHKVNGQEQQNNSIGHHTSSAPSSGVGGHHHAHHSTSRPSSHHIRHQYRRI